MEKTRRSLSSPKIASRTGSARLHPFRYYAGFSEAFVRSVVDGLQTSPGFLVLDPWNGSGTTTASCNRAALASIGFDLNPAMAFVAKSKLVPYSEWTSIPPLLAEICRRTRATARRAKHAPDSDPLCRWLNPATAFIVRGAENSIQRLLINAESIQSQPHLLAEKASTVASFFYTALFTSCRRLLSSLTSSNPTWLKRPSSHRGRLDISADELLTHFSAAVRLQLAYLEDQAPHSDACTDQATVSVGNSEKLPLSAATIDAVITSPPYCTRIDYAMAAQIELAIVGIGYGDTLSALRRSMLGTTTVPKIAPVTLPQWGDSVASFLDQIQKHDSKASATYYLKNHARYFESLFTSVSEIGRVTKANGTVFMVVQDSYYKDIHNDLASHLIDMARGIDLHLVERHDFPISHVRRNHNPRSTKYKKASANAESVLMFRNQRGVVHERKREASA